MKTFNFKPFKFYFYLPILFLTLVLSCQDEVSDIVNPEQEDVIEANSDTANLMSMVALNDGSVDNIIDYANCVEVVLPVTITTNGVTITIQSIEEYAELETLFQTFTMGQEAIQFSYPITLTLNDYSTITINTESELLALINTCNDENEVDDDIECIDIQYPIAFSIYDTDFQVSETVTVDNDEALYLFLESLNASVITSLNFPVTLILADGNTIEVNSNQELEIAIAEAEDDCDEDDDFNFYDTDCTDQAIELALKECIWNLPVYNTTDPLNSYYIQFNVDYSFVTYNLYGNPVHDGVWTVSQNDDNQFILDLDTNWEDLSGSWIIDNCSQTNLFELYNMNTQALVVLEQNCDVNFAYSCFEDITFTVCDDDGSLDLQTTIVLDELYPNCTSSDLNIFYFNTEADANASVNPLASPYTNMSSTEVIYVRVEHVNNPNEFQIFTVNLIVQNCASSCTEGDVDGILQDCKWVISNYEGDSSFNIFNINFENDQNMIINSDNENYTGNWSTSQDGGQVVVTLSDISGGNVQILDGDYYVVECTANQIILHEVTNSNIEVVLDKDCD